MKTWLWRLGRWTLFTVILVATLAFAPRQVGGTTTYVRTTGVSMQPTFQAGDLAIVREADQYQVGDVVAYRDPVLQRTVLHRIVARDGAAFVFQGDNNDFLDDQRLGREYVLGKLWVHVPNGGEAFSWLARPLNSALLVGTLTLGSGAFVQKRSRTRSGGRTRRRAHARRRSFSLPVLSPSAAVWTASAGAICLAVAGVAHLKPTTATAFEPVPYTNSGELSYRGSAPDGPVYEGGAVETGDPVFLRLTQEVDVEFQYRFSSDATYDVAGEIGVVARLTTSSGWERTMQLTRPRPFEGNQARTEATLDLAEIHALLKQVEDVTGVAGGQYMVKLVPTVDLEGSVDGLPLDASFEPEFGFILDGLQWRPLADEPATERFREATPGSVQRPTEKNKKLLNMGPGLDVATARLGGLVAGGVLLVVALVLLLLAWPGRGGEAARIQARYGRLLVDVRSADGGGHKAVVELPTFRALARLAEHYERLVLHHQRQGKHTYLLDVDDSLYRYIAR